MNIIHPTAQINSKTILGNNNRIGPFCIIDQDVHLGDNNILHSNVSLTGNTQIGNDNIFFQGAVIGTDCQDLKYRGEPTKLIIGNQNTFREFCTINRSSDIEEHTTIGNNCLLMAYSHVAHNCHLGDRIIMANSVNLAGHVNIENNVVIGGLSAVSQFTTVGAFSFIGGKSGISKDVPPFIRGGGMPFKVVGLNAVGLQRNGFSIEQIKAIRDVFRIFYNSGMNVSQAMNKAIQIPSPTSEQKQFIDFIKYSQRGIIR